MHATRTFRHLSDDQLTAEVSRLAQHERTSTADLVAGLEEFDRRRLYLSHGFTSIYAYCKERLHLTDGAAYRRIEAARASRRFPSVVEMLRDGRLSLATVCLLAPKLSASNVDDLLLQATHKSKREVEVLLARLHPKPPVPSVLRKLPATEDRADAPRRTAAKPPEASRGERTVSGPQPLPVTEACVLTLPHAKAPHLQPESRRPVVAPLSEAHYKLQVTITAAAHQRLRHIQDLMRHRIPSGDPAAIVERALEVLHAELLKTKAAEVWRPRTLSGPPEVKGRYVPASVKRAVWRRDQARCAFVSSEGRRCDATGTLEFHHLRPYAVGGEATAANIQMRCRAHNGFEWERHLDDETTALALRFEAEP